MYSAVCRSVPVAKVLKRTGCGVVTTTFMTASFLKKKFNSKVKNSKLMKVYKKHRKSQMSVEKKDIPYVRPTITL